jgi:hypothetical protein
MQDIASSRGDESVESVEKDDLLSTLMKTEAGSRFR